MEKKRKLGREAFDLLVLGHRSVGGMFPRSSVDSICGPLEFFYSVFVFFRLFIFFISAGLKWNVER